MNRVATTTTAKLIERALENDQRAWDELVDRYTRLVWHVVLGFRQLGRETQADVHQTTWLRLAERLEQIRDPERLGSWLATTARRECIRVAATSAVVQPSDRIDLPATETPLDAAMLESERDAKLWQAFSTLDETGQRLLRLTLADPPLSYDEIAVLLDMPRGSIGPKRRRYLDELKRQLGEVEDDENAGPETGGL